MASRRRVALTITTLLLVSILSAHGVGATTAVTMWTHVTFDEGASQAADAAWLAGFSSTAREGEYVIALGWWIDRSSWFSVGKLWLVFDRTLAPPGASIDPKNPTLAAVELQTWTPRPGHTYETSLSYEPATGNVSVSLFDLTSGERIAQRGLVTSAASDALIPIPALNDQGAPAPRVTLTRTEPVFLPVGVTWRVAQLFSEGSWGSVTRLDRRLPTAIEVNTPFEGLAGEIVISAQAPGLQEEILRAPAVKGERLISMDPQILPVGRVDLVAAYEEAGSRNILGSREVVVGMATLDVKEIEVNERPDGGLEITGSAEIQGDGDLSGAEIVLEAVIEGLSEVNGAWREATWGEPIVLLHREFGDTSDRLPFSFHATWRPDAGSLVDLHLPRITVRAASRSGFPIEIRGERSSPWPWVGQSDQTPLTAAPVDQAQLLEAPPPERLEKLRRGLNAGGWFRGTYQPDYISDGMLDTLKALGLGHLRIAIGAANLFDPAQPERLNPLGLNHLDAIINRVISRQIAVIVEPHDATGALWSDPKYVERFARFWRYLAAHLSAYDPDLVFLEVANEPSAAYAHEWYALQPTILRAMRLGAPRHTLIANANQRVTPDNWDQVASLLPMEPVDDPNVVYNFHFYAPLNFTHQGASWGWEGWGPLHDLPYPSSPEACEAVLPNIDASARGYARQYCDERWDRSRLERTLQPAFDWASAHGVPLTVNEFGVYRAFAPPESRLNYLRDVREILEANHVGWTMWSYSEGFGLTIDGPTGTRLIDRETAAALGLDVNAAPREYLAID